MCWFGFYWGDPAPLNEVIFDPTTLGLGFNSQGAGLTWYVSGFVDFSFFGVNNASFTSVLFTTEFADFYIGNITTTPPVPEPSTWAMMLLGFAGLGFAFRRSRRNVSSA